MKIGILVNQRSGRNKAQHLAASCHSILAGRGHHVLVSDAVSANEEFIAQQERLLIVGGDGTVHHTLPNLIKHQTPFFHLGTGTSNLIARELKMSRSPNRVADWIEQGGETLLDVPTLDGVPFLIMCNFGMDAGVIHRFEQARSRSGGYRNYIIPVTCSFIQPTLASISIEVDGRELNLPNPMNLIIANMRSYALGINLCNNADPKDGQLNIHAMPCSTSIRWSIESILSLLRLQNGKSMRKLAQSIKITSHSDSTLVQCDGEIARTNSMPQGILKSGSAIAIEIGQFRIPSISPPYS